MAYQDKLSHKNIEDFFLIGIGASAGGLEAYESFFKAMPENSNLNLAFVLVQHLAPEHKSLLTEIIQKCSTMKVYEVEDAMKIESNCIYTIPPNYDMSISNGSFKLLKPLKPHGHRLPIDYFFRSLAQNWQSMSIGIILSGMGSDGTKGIQDIKEYGGLVLAQKITSAEFSGMPLSAINSGFVDYELEPQNMPAKLLKYIKNFSKEKISTVRETKLTNILKKIFLLLKHHTGHDFSMYKLSTIQRRLEKRMAINKIDTIEEYYIYLEESNDEVIALFNDILIGVTSFFRDTEAFASLENEAIPKLFENKVNHDTIRIWIAGCSSGEEAYSIAILLYEYIQKTKQNYTVQIFATDIDERAIEKARAGIYNTDIKEKISKQRLENFFIINKNKDSYSIRKCIRDLLIFSVHNVIKDPPFSKLDMISCRNLLIYMNVELQEKIMQLFHYALNKDGILFLGSSESLGTLDELFIGINLKEKIFQCVKEERLSKSVTRSHFPSTRDITITEQFLQKTKPAIKLPLRELIEESILKYAITSAVLVNEEGDILYLHGQSGLYLELPSGEATQANNIFKMARVGLKKDLKLAFYTAKNDKRSVRVKDLSVKINTQVINIDLKIIIVPIKVSSCLYLVIFDDSFTPVEELISNIDLSPNEIMNKDSFEKNKNIESLQQELYLQKKFLEDANHKLEKSNEELTSYNEEMQSMNEEFQSTNEELETSKEEIQSVNEELSTVNSELQSKVKDLTRVNNDMNNLLAGTSIGIVFVDHDLYILRFTPVIRSIINFINSDIGRPLGDIVSNLVDYEDLIPDIKSVLNTLVIKELEVMSKDKKCFLMRIQPYRTLENVIDGAVISFVDISEIVMMRNELYNMNLLSRLGVVLQDSNDAITVHKLDGKIIAWNAGATRIYGWSEDEALEMNIKSLILAKSKEDEINNLKYLCSSKILEPYKTKRLHKDGTPIDIVMTATALLNEKKEIYAVATTERAYK